MKFSTILFLLSLAAAPIHSIPTSDAANSGEIVPMHITLPTADGPLELIGTYEELIPQIQEAYPDWVPYPESTGLTPTPTSSPNPSLVERYFKNRPTCWLVAGNSCLTWAVTQARNNLKNLPAGTMCGGPPNKCSRTTCADGAALDLCNDRTTSLSILCNRVEKASGDIAHDCQDNFDGETWTKGQWFDTTGYNVVVRRCY
ncbi:hypothetical protein TWF569_003321 [Orbilia oligospora]|uniref:Uncharacterized protein n=1 Tax=Orbilia oligospora TaxID=2813651 RepID=A0A7C8NGY4_ORBOL|nr:hypothetical protein TWF102_008337 [Orbilia oligospora]KAF3093965.1 hypothetical protein TWF103_010649 [Orbilia oligospora]KAF3108229.1 hypothetical protein TWF706_002127 [Orbilia oligospora]KAF3120302.1 hypothetical protein TWF569_003321 [Orbilia oligospora]KAF3120663.1 hypothetical protein TWF703_002367 [Orbilia oligospora]